MRFKSCNHRGKLIQSFIMTGCVLFLILLPLKTLSAKDNIRVGDFSSSSPDILPDLWEPLTFKKVSRHTQYTVIEDNHTMIVKAVSDQSASGLIRKIRIDPEQYPIIKWRWKIKNIFQYGDVTQKAGDDYPARIYITFEYDPDKASFFERIKFLAAKLIFGEDTPFASINYIWASSAPAGTLVANPYTESLQMFIIQSGPKKLNTWIQEERNIYQDYINAFGKKPLFISGIGIMTDSDNTGEKAISYFGDIIMESIK